MFCPSCGTEYAIELNYCNRCGANLTTSLTAPSEVIQVSVTKPVLIVGGVMLMLTLGGFAGVISGAIEVTRAAGGGDLPMAIIFFGMVTILTIDILLSRLLFKLINAALSAGNAPAATRTRTNALPRVEPRAIPPRLETVPSVTEHTTRFFEPAYRAPSESQNPPTSKD